MEKKKECVSVCPVRGHVTWQRRQENRWTQSWADLHTPKHTLYTLDTHPHTYVILPLTHYFITLPVSV